MNDTKNSPSGLRRRHRDRRTSTGRGAGAGPGPRRDRRRRGRLGRHAAPPRRPVHLLPAEHPRPRTVGGRPGPFAAAPGGGRHGVRRQHRRAGLPRRLVGKRGMGAGRGRAQRLCGRRGGVRAGVISMMGEDDLGRTLGTMEQVGCSGRRRPARRCACTRSPRGSAPSEEIAALEQTNFFERWAGGVPAMLRFVQQDGSYQGPRSTDPEVLARISVPVLVLTGQQTRLRHVLHRRGAVHRPARRRPADLGAARASDTSRRCSPRSPSPTS